MSTNWQPPTRRPATAEDYRRDITIGYDPAAGTVHSIHRDLLNETTVTVRGVPKSGKSTTSLLSLAMQLMRTADPRDCDSSTSAAHTGRQRLSAVGPKWVPESPSRRRPKVSAAARRRALLHADEAGRCGRGRAEGARRGGRQASLWVSSLEPALVGALVCDHDRGPGVSP